MDNKDALDLQSTDWGFTLVDGDELSEVQEVRSELTETESSVTEWMHQAEEWRGKANEIYKSFIISFIDGSVGKINILSSLVS